MEDIQSLQQKYLIFVRYVEEPDDTFETLIFAESVLEKEQILENSLG